MAASAALFPIEETTIATLHAAYVSGRATAVSVCQAHLDRIAAYDRKGPALGAIIINNPHQWTGRRAKVGKSDREETFAGATGDDKVDEPRAGRPRPRPDLACGGSPRFSRQHPVLGQPRRGTALIERHPDTIIWPSSSRAHRPRRRSPGPICRRCWSSPSTRTQ